ncbi:hypothetical protein K8O68_18780 [Salipaludibacillus sp. CUR1]|uniref:hypothetical protein n=1 Tax=Salipaludibacillus sp. CUR1 TaxID=2820003 RepID=UPI001E35B64D|nr:hypothetical protein [Salipaludibacillus sp. CUR1]MCE7794430.1 hypothetical protein [Salipaludibacillus sp. CUR1]
MSSNQDSHRQTYDEDHESGRGKQTKVVGLVPAPELPEEIVHKVGDDLPDLLSRFVDDRVHWKIDSVTDPLTGVAGESKQILEKTEESKTQQGWDFAICVTDLPIFQDRLLVVADVNVKSNMAVISLPSLGSTPMKKRVREAIIQMVDEMYHGSSDEARERQERKTEETSKDDDEVNKKGSRQLMSRRLTELLSPIKRVTFSDDSDEEIDVRYLVNSKVSGSIRLISGMVLANRPWTIFPSFKSVLAVAFATGAYALIFPTLWMLSDEYVIWRFLAVMVTSILAMVTWVILAHDLWESPHKANSKFIVRRYNIATFFTLFVGVIFYYVSLFVMFLAAVSLLIPPSLMEEELITSVNFGNYVLLAWLGASFATIIGALGAGLESEETVLNTTYGYRQQKRKEEAREREEREKEEKEYEKTR